MTHTRITKSFNQIFSIKESIKTDSMHDKTPKDIVCRVNSAFNHLIDICPTLPIILARNIKYTRGED